MKHKTLTILATLLMAAPTFAAEDLRIGVVNFGSCLTESKAGKKEQEHLDGIRKEIISRAQETEKELQEIRAKFDDAEFMDGLSPKAEEELQAKRDSLEQDLGRYDQQYNQIMQYSQYQIVQKMVGDISKAAQQVAAEKNLSYIMNKENLFYADEKMDVTSNIIDVMDVQFDEAAKKLSENEAAASKEMTEQKAG